MIVALSIILHFIIVKVYWSFVRLLNKLQYKNCYCERSVICVTGLVSNVHEA